MREVPFHRPCVGSREIEEVVDSLRSGWLTMGPKTVRFEQELARALGCGQAVAVNSCTAALHLALVVAGVGPGDEVVVPDMTFTATAEVVFHCGARPVIVDVDPRTLNMDPEALEAAVGARTRAVIPVHHSGQPCDMDEIMAIAGGRNLTVIEDAAHALPASYRGRKVGTIGDFTCFSFYATKTLATGEGGLVATGDEEAARRMRVLRLHGISEDAWKRYSREGSWRYEVMEAGFKYNMTDLQAALGLAQLEKLDWMRDRRRDIARRYDEAFAGVTGLDTPAPLGDRESAWHLYVLRLDPAKLTVDRDRFIEELRERGVGTGVHFIPLHRHPLYRRRLGCRDRDYPNAEAAFARILSLPIYPDMADEDVEHVTGAVLELARNSRR